MKRTHAISLACFLGSLVAMLTAIGTGAAADQHALVASHAPGFKPVWKLDGKQSNGAQPLIVEVKKGDVLRIDSNDDSMDHGFVTIAGEGSVVPLPKEDKTFVQTCIENRPEAVLKEVDCGVSTPSPEDWFGAQEGFKGVVKLEVTDKFANDVNFWCTVHDQTMWGKIKLKP